MFTDEQIGLGAPPAQAGLSDADIGLAPQVSFSKGTPREGLMQQLVALRQQQDPGGLKTAETAYNVVEPFTGTGMLNQVAALANIPDWIRTGIKPAPFQHGQPIGGEMSPQTGTQVMQYLNPTSFLQGPTQPLPQAGAVPEGLGRVLAGLVNVIRDPDVAVPAALGGESALVRALFGAQVAGGVPEQVKEGARTLGAKAGGDTSVTGADVVAGVANPVVGALLAKQLFKAPELPPSRFEGYVDKPRADEMEIREGRVPLENRLPAPPTKIEQATQAEAVRQQMASQQPPAPTFLSGPSGITPSGDVAGRYEAAQIPERKLLAPLKPTIEQRLAELEAKQQQPSSKPPIISGVEGMPPETGALPITREQISLGSGVQPNEDLTRRIQDIISEMKGDSSKQEVWDWSKDEFPQKVKAILPETAGNSTAGTLVGFEGRMGGRNGIALVMESKDFPKFQSDAAEKGLRTVKVRPNERGKLEPSSAADEGGLNYYFVWPDDITKMGSGVDPDAAEEALKLIRPAGTEKAYKDVIEKDRLQQESKAKFDKMREEAGLQSGVRTPTKEEWQKLGDVFAAGAKKVVLTEFPNQDAKLDAQQMWNRVKNKLGVESSEVKALEASGMAEAVKGKQMTPKEMQGVLDEKVPRVEVRRFGAGAMTPEQTKYNQMTHEWYDQQGTRFQQLLNSYYDKGFTPEQFKAVIDRDEKGTGLHSNADLDKFSTKAGEYMEARRKAEAQGQVAEQSHWQSIAPKSEQDMPGYVEIAVVKPLKPGYQSKAEQMSGDNFKSKEQLGIQFPSSHSFPPNTLGFVRGYMEGDTFHVIEVQRDLIDKDDETNKFFIPSHRQYGQFDTYGQAAAKLKEIEPMTGIEYERLALKAAIEHARSGGATKIAISDAETAMMTEGHDRSLGGAAELPPEDYTGTPQQWIRDHPYQQPKEPIQAKGMRLHYDKILQKIAEELTGGKGEKVSFGEHKMAENRVGEPWQILDAQGRVIANAETEAGAQRQLRDIQQGGVSGGPFSVKLDESNRLRKNLIFRNPDGTPKTNVSALSYPLEKVSARRETGEPFSMQGKLYSGIDIDTVKDAAKRVSRYLVGHQTRQAMSAGKDAASNLATKAANEAANDVLGPLKRSVGVEANKKNSLDRQALSFVREADGNKAELDIMKKKIGASKDVIPREAKQALAAIDRAKSAWDKLDPIASKYAEVTERELKAEIDSGKDVERRKGYVMHLAEDTGDATSFLHKREFDTFADRIAAGKPVGSLDAIELLRTRVHRGQQVYVQSALYRDALKTLKDPTLKLPVVGEYEHVSRGAGRPDDLRPPKGYKEVQLGAVKAPVLNDYASTLQALTTPSFFMQSAVGRTAMEIRGSAKAFKLGIDVRHLGRIALYGEAAKVGTGNIPYLNVKRGLTVLDNSVNELKERAKAGEFTPEQLDSLLERKRKVTLGIQTGYNVGRVVDMFNQHWIEKTPVIGQFQQWLFNSFQRGTMEDVFINTFDAYKKQYPKLTDVQLAKKAGHDLNEVFGTIGRQGWIKSRSAQDIASTIFLAPQWNEGRIKTEFHAATGTVKGIASTLQGKPQFNIQSRVVGSIILMYLVANQAINYATKGHSTFENEEGHKMDAFIPDVVGKSVGYWLSPTSNAEEILHAASNSFERAGGNAWEAWLDFAGSRLSAVAQPAAVAVTGKKYGLTGPTIPKEDKLKEGLIAAFPKPIGTEAVGDLIRGKQDPSVEKQFLTSAGLNVDYGLSDRQLMYKKARQWKKETGVPDKSGDYPPGPYIPLASALRRGDTEAAKNEYSELVAQVGARKVENYFSHYSSMHLFTGSKENEDKFVASLSPQDKATYDTAKSHDAEVEARFWTMLGKPQPAKRGEEQKPLFGRRGKKGSNIFK